MTVREHKELKDILIAIADELGTIQYNWKYARIPIDDETFVKLENSITEMGRYIDSQV